VTIIQMQLRNIRTGRHTVISTVPLPEDGRIKIDESLPFSLKLYDVSLRSDSYTTTRDF